MINTNNNINCVSGKSSGINRGEKSKSVKEKNCLKTAKSKNLVKLKSYDLFFKLSNTNLQIFRLSFYIVETTLAYTILR